MSFNPFCAMTLNNMRSLGLLLTAVGLLLCQVSAGNGGKCAHDCIESLNITDCNSYDGWNCLCTSLTALESVNNCVTSSCSSADQNSTFAGIAQACANRGSPITDAPAAEATFSATAGGNLFASGEPFWNWGWRGDGQGRGDHCSETTFTGSWSGGWLVSWSGLGACSSRTGSSPTATTSPSAVSATTTATANPSLGATVVTTVNGQTLTGTIFSTDGAAAVSTAGETLVAAQNAGLALRGRLGALTAMAVALLAAVCML